MNFLVGLVVCAVLAITSVGLLVKASCYAAWEDSGLQVRWSAIGDCQVSEDGKIWLPSTAYREVLN